MPATARCSPTIPAAPRVLCDGSVRFLAETMDVQLLLALASRSDGEVIDSY